MTQQTPEHKSDEEKRVGGGKPPEIFKIQIDKEFYEIMVPLVTGRKLLEIAGKVPPEQFALYLKPKGGQPQRIELNDEVDLRRPGVERFVTLPLDQTEGEGTLRLSILK